MRDRPAGGRKRLRLPEYNYSTPGAYFFTIVTISRQHLFGCIANDSMVLNDAGAAVTGAWRELPDRFPELELDEFVVMPNHVHGITWLTEHALHLGKVMRALKSLSAREVNRVLDREGPVWQRSYHERVIRNEAELRRFRAYIVDNPGRWALDEENITGTVRG
jgi:REP element-mobilizing transposase RayT